MVTREEVAEPYSICFLQEEGFTLTHRPGTEPKQKKNISTYAPHRNLRRKFIMQMDNESVVISWFSFRLKSKVPSPVRTFIPSGLPVQIRGFSPGAHISSKAQKHVCYDSVMDW